MKMIGNLNFIDNKKNKKNYSQNKNKKNDDKNNVSSRYYKTYFKT